MAMAKELPQDGKEAQTAAQPAAAAAAGETPDAAAAASSAAAPAPGASPAVGEALAAGAAATAPDGSGVPHAPAAAGAGADAGAGATAAAGGGASASAGPGPSAGAAADAGAAAAAAAAAAGGGSPSLRSFLDRELPDGLLEARRLREAEADEREPYRPAYAAGDLLASLRQRAAGLAEGTEAEAAAAAAAAAAAGGGGGGGAACGELARAAAACGLLRGLALLDTDLTAEGQEALDEALGFAWPPSRPARALLLCAHNALAGLWCGREEFEASLRHLREAERLYGELQREGGGGGGSVGPEATAAAPAEEAARGRRQAAAAPGGGGGDGGAGAGVSAWEAAVLDAAQVAPQHTTTLYYAAQVYGHMGDKARSAAYCAATLDRQLAAGDVDINEWVQNCLQLSGYFLDCNAFALSRYCCAAVEQMLLDRHSAQAEDAAPQPGSAGDQQQGREAAGGGSKPPPSGGDRQEQEQDGCGKDQGSKQEAGTPGKQGADAKAADAAAAAAAPPPQQQQQPPGAAKAEGERAAPAAAGAVAGAPSARLGAALRRLDPDVAANVRLALGKLHLYRLVASHERYVEGRRLQYEFPSAASVPPALRFRALPALPPLEDLRWGDDALVADGPGALGLFREAMPWFRAALEHYRLDGWVTEHTHILFEMSNLHRCLAGFERDPHKRCVVHRSRARLLAPLEGELSPKHYPGLSRSISLELGNIHREVADIKAAAGREPAKVAAAAAAAARHYQLFLCSFAGEGGGPLPGRVEPEMEGHFLGAAFSLAHMLQASAPAHKAPSERVAALQRSVSWLEELRGYVSRNGVEVWQQQAQLAGEMAALLKEKVALMQRAAGAAGAAPQRLLQ